MTTDQTIRVLLVANEFDAARILLQEDYAGNDLEIVEARSHQDFLGKLEREVPDVVVIESQGIPGLTLGQVLESAASSPHELPVVVLGEDGQDGQDAIHCIGEGAADYIPISHVKRLPLVLRRVRRDREVFSDLRRMQSDLRLAHTAMLENQKLMAIGRLAASIAHEINNPLESITNLLYLLRSEPGLSRTAMNYIALAEQEMDRVAQISKQTLNFYRDTRSPIRVRASDLLEEVLILYSRKIEERRMQVVRQFRSEESLFVFPGEMRQVLSNLVTNAIEASPDGGKLVLRVHRARKWSDEGISGMRIVIADTGSGIDAETRQNLGQIFYTTKGQRGTGLGLWVTQAIVKRYGGEIQLYSSTRPGRHGTVFSIFMPTNMRPHAVMLDSGSIENSGNPRNGKRPRTSGDNYQPEEDQRNAEDRRSRSYRRNRSPLVAS
jgi:signal transduction histidine kinase